MKTMTKVLTTALALGSAVTISGAASAQDWHGPGYGGGHESGYDWGGGPDGSWRDRQPVDRRLAYTTCTGKRGYWMESRLQAARERGQIDWRTARRIQKSIDRLQWREQHECSEGDYRAATRIGLEYDRIGAWIARESASYGNGNWGGGYWRR